MERTIGFRPNIAWIKAKIESEPRGTQTVLKKGREKKLVEEPKPYPLNSASQRSDFARSCARFEMDFRKEEKRDL